MLEVFNRRWEFKIYVKNGKLTIKCKIKHVIAPNSISHNHVMPIMPLIRTTVVPIKILIIQTVKLRLSIFTVCKFVSSQIKYHLSSFYSISIS